MSALPDWRRVAAPVACGRLRATPDDFRVEERLDIDLSGDGEHDWLWIEKRGANTAWVSRQLARHAGVAARDVGYAGLKDRHAVTRQWFSVRRATGAGTDWQSLSIEGVTLLGVHRHQRKLKRGAHRGNAFRIRITGLQGDPGPALERIGRDGVPNYFGEQRFGRDAGNLVLAARCADGARLGREQRSLALSAARSLLFNDWLDGRVADGTWNRLGDGDIAMLDGSHSHFAVERVDDELAARCAAFDLHPTGPLWGRDDGSRPAAEHALRERHPALAALLERQGQGARRALRLRPAALQWTLADGELELAFELPGGAFATAVLREVVDYRDIARTQSRRSST